MRPNKDFYERDTADVAKDLLGKRLVRGVASGKIVETEAYYGNDDPASHASNGKTERNSLMFGEPGRVYVYLCYGMHHLLNVTTESEGVPGAVLIRAVEPLEGVGRMRENRGGGDITDLASGPGKLCEAFGIDRTHNGEKIFREDSTIRITGEECVRGTGRSKRIGVSEEHEEDLRFYIKDCEYVSQ